MTFSSFKDKITSFDKRSRVWVYQSERFFTESEQSMINEELTTFCSSWAAHGTSLKSDFFILYDLFIVLIVDERVEPASGCSIDSSVRVIKAIGDKLSINFFNRFSFAALLNDKIIAINKQDLNAIQNKEDLLVFDNSVSTLEALLENWKVPFNSSWQKTQLNQAETFSLNL